MMIKSLSIEGLKSFTKAELSLGALTLLTGLNNSGKSTVLQALRMCSDKAPEAGPYLQGLGAYPELKSNLTAPSTAVTVVATSDGGEIHVEILEGSHRRTKAGISPLIQFVSADRFGPKVELPIPLDESELSGVGERGEFSAHFAGLVENFQVPDPLRHSSSSSSALKHQLSAWMSEVSPGVKLDFFVDRKFDASRVEIDSYRATNTGFGLSYALPVVLLVLASTSSAGKDTSKAPAMAFANSVLERGATLLIENPEAHLHPRGQTAIGRLLATAASLGTQMVVETHSDHILDGVRLAVRRMKSEFKGDFQVAFLSKDQDQETKVDTISIGPDGKLEKWPAGLFDQMGINLRDLSSPIA